MKLHHSFHEQLPDKQYKTLPPAEMLPRNEVLGGFICVCNKETMQEDAHHQLFGNFSNLFVIVPIDISQSQKESSNFFNFIRCFSHHLCSGEKKKKLIYLPCHTNVTTSTELNLHKSVQLKFDTYKQYYFELSYEDMANQN